MYGASPAYFAKRKAAEHVARGYSLDDGSHWVILAKESSLGIMYKPVLFEDIEPAADDGWVEPIECADCGKEVLEIHIHVDRTTGKEVDLCPVCLGKTVEG